MARARVFDAPADTRVRVRPTGDNLPPALLELADAYYTANKTKNKASAAEAKAKKELHKAMAKAGVSQFEFIGVFEGTSTEMEAAIRESMDSEVDVAKLRKMVTPEVFMTIISATKTSVKEHAGEDILMQCEVDVTKPPSLKVQKAASNG